MLIQIHLLLVEHLILQKLSAVRTTINKSGMYGTIRVMQNGYIIDGNHRVAVARLLGIAVDVVIG